jgi:hypothetical protein
MTTAHRTYVGVFPSHTQAQQAVGELKRMGFSENQIGVVGRDSPATASAEPAAHSKAGEGAAVGAATGAGVGALWALGIAAGMLPAIGPIIAGGLLASVLASAAGGAAVAGLVGALVGLGIPEEEAHYYEGEVKSGRTLVTVKTDNRGNEVQALFQQLGAYDMHNATAQTSSTVGTPHPVKGIR